jgi:activator of 2-hydroxyglutaryl-CoA dehydratase
MLSLAVAGCATVPGSQPTGSASGQDTQAAAIVAHVQAATTTACKFLPTAKTILDIVGTFTDVVALSPVTSVADAICNAVSAQGSGKLARRSTPRVRGVVVKGRFVR